MKKKWFYLFLTFACISIKAQTIYFRPKTGLQSSYTVANLQKLTFSSGNILVTNITGTNDSFALADNRYINFKDLTLRTVSHQIAKKSFYVYPNPTAAILYAGNDDASQVLSNLKIISLDGRVLIEKNNSQVEVASLPTGMYFCKITFSNQTQTIKFLKQ